ncbi:MAG TPA: histidine kinase, partial [Marinagarivorans sp.]
GFEMGSFGLLVGQHFEDTDELTHVNLSYAYNDNLSFTISAPVGSNDGDLNSAGELISVDEDPLFVVSYTLPLGE